MSERDIHGRRERTLRDLLEALFRHKKKALLFFLTMVATAVVVLAYTPGEYTSTAKLMIRRGREDVFLDPSTASGGMQPLYKEWESEINTELEILGSSELVFEVVQSFGPERFLEAPKPSRSGLLSPVRFVLNPVRYVLIKCRSLISGLSARKTAGKEPEQVDRAVQIVQKNLRIEARKKSDIITVSYTALSPELARQVVTHLVDTYLDRRINVHKVPGAHLFFGQQTERLLSELKMNEESINAIKNRAGISSLEDSRNALQTAIAAVRAQRLQNESSLAAVNSRVMTLRTMLSQQAPADSVVKSGALLDRTEYQTLQATLRNEEITQAALIAGSREYDQQLKQLREELATMSTLDAPLSKLQREQEMLEEKYRNYSEDKEKARINEELEIRKISNVSIVQHATLPGDENPSGKLFKLLAAVFLGLIGALSIALGADYMDPTLYSANDIAGHLNLPVMIELPFVPENELYSFIYPSLRQRAFVRSGGDWRQEIEDYFQELLFKILALRNPGGTCPLTVGLTSTFNGEGVSSAAANLSAAFARDGRYPAVLLLDASMKAAADKSGKQDELGSPFTYQHLNCANDSAASPADAAMFSEYLTRGDVQRYDVVVVDLPPVSQGGITARMAAALDVVILVVDAGHIPWRTAQWGVRLLTEAKAELCGVVLNRQCSAMPKWLYRKL